MTLFSLLTFEGWDKPSGIFRCYVFDILKVKGKAIPLQAWRGPEGSGRLRIPDFKTVGT